MKSCKYGLLTFVLISLLYGKSTSTSSAPTDSLTAHRRDTLRMDLFPLLSRQFAGIYSFETEHTVHFPQDSLNRYNLERSDRFSWTDLLNTTAPWHGVSFAPGSYLNRPLYRGYPFPAHRGDPPPQLHGATLPWTLLQPIYTRTVPVEKVNSRTITGWTAPVATTDLTFNTETGLFNGNILNLRFLRNITDSITLGVYTSFSNMDSIDYSHDKGSMYDIYKDLGIRETHISDTGTNPFTHSRISTFEIAAQNPWNPHLRYTYGDMRQDLRYTYAAPNIPGDTSYLFRSSDYLSRVTGEISRNLTQTLSLSLQGSAESVTHT
ncbi:MAG: hypothetical protein ACQEQV_02285, partial [Fibrobacterota bacterium]